MECSLKLLKIYLVQSSESLRGRLFTTCSCCLYLFVNFKTLDFSAILNDLKKTSTPFLQLKISKLQKALQEYSKENDITLETKTQAMKQRDRKSVSKTFNGLGLVVPVEKRTEVGYRELIETDGIYFLL